MCVRCSPRCVCGVELVRLKVCVCVCMCCCSLLFFWCNQGVEGWDWVRMGGGRFFFFLDMWLPRRERTWMAVWYW